MRSISTPIRGGRNEPVARTRFDCACRADFRSCGSGVPCSRFLIFAQSRPRGRDGRTQPVGLAATRPPGMTIWNAARKDAASVFRSEKWTQRLRCRLQTARRSRRTQSPLRAQSFDPPSLLIQRGHITGPKSGRKVAAPGPKWGKTRRAQTIPGAPPRHRSRRSACSRPALAGEQRSREPQSRMAGTRPATMRDLNLRLYLSGETGTSQMRNTLWPGTKA
jgi:hypothetical protein